MRPRPASRRQQERPRPPRQDAERECLSAIAFALEGDPSDYDRDAEALTLDVSVAPAA